MGYATVPFPQNDSSGFNDVDNHPVLIAAYQRAIPLAAAAGVPNLICFSGNRRGISDNRDAKTAARGLAPL